MFSFIKHAYRLDFRYQFRNDSEVRATTVGVDLNSAEMRAWGRAATVAGVLLGDWIRAVVNQALIDEEFRLAVEAERFRLPQRPRRVPRPCWWCGADLPLGATRRRRYCTAECRVRAWRAERAVHVAQYVTHRRSSSPH